ncbi:hypothetical protein MLD38_028611 [Melastoma candidum]|uniref:Uncharacterized protein n=1 Tax=Melastoma candidum TaxID=119954 RepID=A0ACB9N179_9MYRT|nr:hypothetical protein MLD38_028611 [Melastoma candidum]
MPAKRPRNLKEEDEEMTSRRTHNNSLNNNTPPHFFKVILHDDLLQGNLRIPRKFAQKHGTSLPALLHLQLPSGHMEQVELWREDGDLFLQNGWADFARLCCISFGYFVVFRYEGDSLFHVVVFDVTACEIEYPARPGTGRSPGSGDTRPSPLPRGGRTGQGEEVPVIELSDDEDRDPCLRSDRKKPPSGCPRSSKRSRAGSPGTDTCTTGVDPSALETRFRNSVDDRHRGSKRVASAATSSALRRASSFKCKRPSTIVTVQPKRGLYMPRNFWIRCFPGSGIRDIKVHVSGKKTWTISASSSIYPKFRRGWNEFLADNNIHEGDVCLFEVMASTEADFRVVILRTGDVAQMPRDSVDSECDDEVCGMNPFSQVLTGETSSTNPLVNLRPSDILSRKKLQVQFPLVSSQEVGKTGEEKVQVRYLNEDGGSDVFVDGNRNSDRERSLPLCDRSSKSLVNVFQGTNAPMATSTHSSPLQEPTERLHLKYLAEFGIRVAGDESPGTFQRASRFLSERPCCIVVCSMRNLYFPKSFLTRCFPDGNGTIGEIKVHVCGKGTWTLVASKERYPRFSRGWKEFVAGNELRESDVCLFKPARSGDNEFEAVVFHGEGEMTVNMRVAVRRAKTRHGKSENMMKESSRMGGRGMEWGNGNGENNLYF